MRHFPQCVLLLALALLGTAPVRAALLTVAIDGVRSNDGTIAVAVFNQPKGFPEGDYAMAGLRVAASVKPIVVVFDLPPGVYAVGAYHDEDNNGHLDQTFLGFPAEGYALSNGVRALLWRPRFADASFTLSDNGTCVALHMEY